MSPDPYDTGPYLQWEIRDVRWMYQDGVGEKRRKAILISDNQYNSNRANLFLVFLKFSTKDRPSRYKIPIKTTHPEWASMGLTKECYLYVDKSQRIPRDKVDRLKGRVGAILGAQVVAMLRQIEQDDQAGGTTTQTPAPST